MLQRELWAKLTHDTNFERGSVVSLRYIFTSPPEEKKKKGTAHSASAEDRRNAHMLCPMSVRYQYQ